MRCSICQNRFPAARYSRSLWRTHLVAWLSVCSIGAQQIALQVPARHASYSPVPGTGLPEFSNGYLIWFPRQLATTNQTSFLLTNVADNTQRYVELSLDKAAAVVEDASTTRSGTLLIAGSYVRSGSISNFLGTLDPVGTYSVSVDLGVYTPERICSTADGTIWTLGQEWSKELAAEPQDYAMLRSYSGDGTLRNYYLNRSALTVVASISLHRLGPPSVPAFLSCGDDMVGVYIALPGSGSGYWLEVQPSSGTSRSWTVPIIPDFRITGLTVTSQHIVCASFVGINGDRRLYSLSLNRHGSANWSELSLKDENPSRFVRLLGSDGDYVVYVKLPNQSGSPIIYWSRPTTQ